MHGAFTVLVVAKRLDRQWQQRGFLFNKHRGNLPFGRAMDAVSAQRDSQLSR